MTAQPVRVGLLSNVLSRRNARGLGKFDALVSARNDVMHLKINGVEGLDFAIARVLDAGVDVVAINGGDGFVQASLTALDRLDASPLVAVLPGGATNVIAYDVGRSTRREAGLRGLFAMIDDRLMEVTRRATIALTHRPGERRVLGMFFGGASITRAIAFTRREIHSKGFDSSAASAAAIGSLMLRRAFRAGEGTQDAVVRGDAIEMRIDDDAARARDLSLVLVTTLDRLILRSRPYWGAGAGALRHTEVSHPAPDLCRATPKVLWGGETRALPPEHFASGRARRIAYRMDAPYTLDGEIFTPSVDAPVVLEEGPTFRFLAC